MTTEQQERAHHVLLMEVCNDLSHLIVPPSHIALPHADFMAGVVAVQVRVFGYLRTVAPPFPVEDRVTDPARMIPAMPTPPHDGRGRPVLPATFATNREASGYVDGP